MANSATVYARIDPELKHNVELILKQLGITPSSLIQMLYSEINLTKKIPLNLSIPQQKPIFLEGLREDDLVNEIQKGLDDLEAGRTYTLEEAEKILRENNIIK